jgi:hypothetical protein
VQFGGLPLITFQGQDVGDADTIVQRTENATLAPPFPRGDFIPIELVSLSLQSIQPIVVDVGGTQQLWDVFAAQSPSRPSQGVMFLQQTEEQGGAFDSQLQVFPKFTFTRLSDGMTREIDVGQMQLGAESQRKLILSSSEVPWRAGCIPPALVLPGLNDAFCPGQTIPGEKTLNVEQAALARHGVYPVQPRLEHFQCHPIKPHGFRQRTVDLIDQFSASQARVQRPRTLCAPAQKNKEPFRNRRAHLECFSIRRDRPFAGVSVAVRDQFAGWPLRVGQPRTLCLPSSKSRAPTRRPPELPEAAQVDHFTCYDVEVLQRARVRRATVRDQFGRVSLRLLRPDALCLPTDKNKSGIQHSVQHLLCYRVELRNRGTFRPRVVRLSNQFGTPRVTVRRPGPLCLPARKVVLEGGSAPGS